MEEREAERTLQEVLAKISQREKRLTPQRIVLTRLIMSKVKDHPSLKDLYKDAQQDLPRVGISTVYNTIKMLESLGVLDTFMVGDKLHIDQPHPHINVVCLNTSTIFDIDDSIASQIFEELSRKGLKVRKVIVESYCDKGAQA